MRHSLFESGSVKTDCLSETFALKMKIWQARIFFDLTLKRNTSKIIKVFWWASPISITGKQQNLSEIRWQSNLFRSDRDISNIFSFWFFSKRWLQFFSDVSKTSNDLSFEVPFRRPFFCVCPQSVFMGECEWKAHTGVKKSTGNFFPENQNFQKFVKNPPGDVKNP